MSKLGDADRQQLECFSRLCYENPFGPGRIALERELLGERYRHVQDAWRLRHGSDNPNVDPLTALSKQLLDKLRARWSRLALSETQKAQYQDLVRYYLFNRFDSELLSLTEASFEGDLSKQRVPFYKELEQALRDTLESVEPSLALEPAHLLALMLQLRRAFVLVYSTILGASRHSVALRAAIWESIFTHDMRRYQRSLFDRMQQIPTLITGPSGTGKELVARAIGLSRYVPFDPVRGRFRSQSRDFFALNIAALSSTVVESELFGHTKGAFTDAVRDRRGWLELTGPSGTLFLDEIGELSLSIQVKLLRVLQDRAFARVGESEERAFEGKLIAATNRSLPEEIEAGRFREDFYYRLCADSIQTPALRAQLSDSPEDLQALVEHAVRRLVSEPEQAEATREVLAGIERSVGDDYAWPGNVRELEQCVRAILIRGSYQPGLRGLPQGDVGKLLHAAAERGLSADALLDAYCRVVYAREGSYVGAAELLELDRRTVRARVHES